MRNLIIVIAGMIVLTGCTTTQQDAVTGGLAGAAIGGIVGHQSGHGVTGAAIGGAVGTVGGMAVGEMRSKKFCPVCGREYTEDKKYCPEDGTELKYKQ